MSGLPGGEPADVTLESDVPLLEDFPPGDVRRLPEAQAIHIKVYLLRLHQASAKYWTRITHSISN
jgi:hypothetical protein